jgi:hypothetical protein
MECEFLSGPNIDSQLRTKGNQDILIGAQNLVVQVRRARRPNPDYKCIRDGYGQCRSSSILPMVIVDVKARFG